MLGRNVCRISNKPLLTSNKTIVDFQVCKHSHTDILMVQSIETFKALCLSTFWKVFSCDVITV